MMMNELDSQKLVIAAQVRLFDTSAFVYEEDSVASKGQKRSVKDDGNVSQTSIGSKASRMNASRVGSQSMISIKSAKSGMTSASAVSKSNLGGTSSSSSKPKPDSKVNLYACRHSDKVPFQQLVNLSKQPLSYSLLSKHFPTDSNFESNQLGLLPASKQYKFDIAFSHETSQDRIYATLLQKRMKQVLNGFQLTTILVGESDAGKKYLLRGDDNIMNKQAHSERGLMLRACEDLLSMMNISRESIRSRKAIQGGVYYNLGVQIYCVKSDVEVDLLVNAPEQLLNREQDQEVEMGCFDISDVADLLTYYRQAQNRFTMIHDTLSGLDFKRHSSIFIRLLILKNKQVYSSVNFVNLFDYEESELRQLTPILEYISEVEKLHSRQMKAYSFSNKVLQHLNKCFSSGPEYSAILLGTFDTNPASLGACESLLSAIASIRDRESAKNQEKSLKLRLSTKEVREFVLNSHRKSIASEQNETAGFIDSDQEIPHPNSNNNIPVNQRQLSNSNILFNEESQIGREQKQSQQQQQQQQTNPPNRKSDRIGSGTPLSAGGSGVVDFEKPGNNGRNPSRKVTMSSEILIEDTHKESNNGGIHLRNGSSSLQQLPLGGQGGVDLSFNSSDVYGQTGVVGSNDDVPDQEEEVEEEEEQVQPSNPKDVKQLIGNVFNFSESTKGMNPAEIAQWIRCQERNLDLLNNSMQALQSDSYLLTAAEQQSMRKLKQAKAFLADLKGSQAESVVEENNEVVGERKKNKKTASVKSEQELVEKEHSRNVSNSNNSSEVKHRIMEQIDRTIEQNMRASQQSMMSQLSSSMISNRRIATQETEKAEVAEAAAEINDTSDRIMQLVNTEYSRSSDLLKRKQVQQKEKKGGADDDDDGGQAFEVELEMARLQEEVKAMREQISNRDKIIYSLETQLQSERKNSRMQSELSLSVQKQQQLQVSMISGEAVEARAQKLTQKLAAKKALVEELKDEIILRERRFADEREQQAALTQEMAVDLEQLEKRLQAEIRARQQVEQSYEQMDLNVRSKDNQIDRMSQTLREKEKGIRELQNLKYAEEDTALQARSEAKMLERKISDLANQMNRYEDEMNEQRNTFERERRSLQDMHEEEIARLKEKNRVLKEEVKFGSRHPSFQASVGQHSSHTNRNPIYNTSSSWMNHADETHQQQHQSTNKSRLY